MPNDALHAHDRALRRGRWWLSAVLIFVGLKMAWLNEAFGGKFPITWSLGIIAGVLGTSVAVSYRGKVKTAAQMIAITGLLAIDPARDESWLLALCYLVLYTAAVLTIWSMFVYLKAAWVVIKDENKSL